MKQSLRQLFNRRKRAVIYTSWCPTLSSSCPHTEAYALRGYAERNGYGVAESFYDIDEAVSGLCRLEEYYEFCKENKVNDLLVYSLCAFGSTVGAAEAKFRHFREYPWNIHLYKECVCTRLGNGRLNPELRVVDGMFSWYRTLQQRNKVTDLRVEMDNLYSETSC